MTTSHQLHDRYGKEYAGLFSSVQQRSYGMGLNTMEDNLESHLGVN